MLKISKPERSNITAGSTSGYDIAANQTKRSLKCAKTASTFDELFSFSSIDLKIMHLKDHVPHNLSFTFPNFT